jgi:outer membrane protein assembly factor BamA
LFSRIYNPFLPVSILSCRIRVWKISKRYYYQCPMIRRIRACASKSASLIFLLLFWGNVESSNALAQPSPYGKIVREIRIQGLRVTRESVVRDQLASRIGHVYTEETERNDYRWLYRLKVFSSIHESAAVIGEEVVLSIDVHELPVFLPFPTLNITRENHVSGGLGGRIQSLMHNAVALSGSAKFGGLTEADISVQAPWRLRRREWYAAKYNYRDRINKQDSFRENSHELNLRFGLSPHPDWMVSGRFSFLSIGSDIPGITLSPTNRDNTPAIGAAVEYDGRDSVSDTHRGWQTIFDVTQNGGFLGGNGDFVTTQVDVRRYQPLAARHILAVFSFVTFQSGVVGKDVPVYRDYQIGGTNTVRGWNDDAREGNNQFINTVEYRYELIPPTAFRVYKFNLYAGLQLAAFADLGTAWSESADFTRNVIAGGGFGFRVLVPFVNMIRMDFGFGQSGTGIHSHFYIREKAHYTRDRIR